MSVKNIRYTQRAGEKKKWLNIDLYASEDKPLPAKRQSSDQSRDDNVSRVSKPEPIDDEITNHLSTSFLNDSGV